MVKGDYACAGRAWAVSAAASVLVIKQTFKGNMVQHLACHDPG